MKRNLPFVIVMMLFVIACAVVTMFTIKNEPQYVRVEKIETQQVEAVPDTDKVNINTATVEELQTLKGIGETRAELIVAYREEHGGFLYIEEIMEISGIGEKIFEDIKESICVD